MAKPTSLQKFEDSQEAKMKYWKTNKVTYTHTAINQDSANPNVTQTEVTDNRTNEQKAFDEYLQEKAIFDGKLIMPFHEGSTHYKEGMSLDDYKGYVGREVNFWTDIVNYNSITNSKNAEIIITNCKVKEDPNTTVTMYGTVTRTAGNLQTFGMTVKGVSTFSKATGGSTTITAEAHANSVPSSQSANAQVTAHDGHLNFTFDIPRGEKGADGSGGGGGGSTPATVPANTKLAEVKGDFGLNLFHYREMSQDNKFRVSGHTFMNNAPTKINEDTNYIKKLKRYNRFEETTSFQPQSINYEATLIETDEVRQNLNPNHDLEALISFSNKTGDIDKFPIQIPAEKNFKKGTLDTRNKTYGFLQFQIGGKKNPVKGKMRLDAWYGGIKPEGQSQKFEFKKYNGIDLIKNGHGTCDVYRHYTWWDAIQKNLNVVKLSDCELINDSPDERENNNIFFLRVPDDCVSYIGTREEDPHKAQKIAYLKENLMTSNLCDVTSEDADASVDVSDKPFFITALTPKMINTKAEGVKEVLCFQLILGKKNMYKWRKHLSETEIIYPTRTGFESKDDLGESNKHFTQLPLGGMIYVLNNGQQIETNKYGQIKADGNDIVFFNSPFGYPTIRVKYGNVASIIENSFHKEQG